MFFKDRQALTFLINKREYKTGVEVGVWKGEFSEWLLYESRLKKLYSIDKWVNHNGDDDWYHHEWAEEECRRRLEPFGDRSVIVKKWSTDAAGDFPNWSLDFVYLDAGKDHRSITDDILYWYDKVSWGGILAGKDYTLLPWEGCSIMAAVDRMVDIMGLSLNVTGTQDADDPIQRHHLAYMNSPINSKNRAVETPTWWITKPKKKEEDG
tara:strand:- start:1931 stop:2557 length:627 start_codon:yes stop_codon:yes gene_type:complete